MGTEIKRRAHARRYGCGSKNLKRARGLFTGSLPADQRWILGHEGRYAISDRGIPYSYRADGSCRKLIITQRGKHPYLTLFVDDEKRWLRVSDLIAHSFLGVTPYVFLDNDSTNVCLENIAPIGSVMRPDEVSIEGFEEYTIDSSAKIYSYKYHKRTKLKMCNSLSKSKRVCLTNSRGEQETFYAEELIKKYLKLH